jgi:hypothetical protein
MNNQQPLPLCHWRAWKLGPDHYACVSPKVQAPRGVTGDLCRQCGLCDHECGTGVAWEWPVTADRSCRCERFVLNQPWRPGWCYACWLLAHSPQYRAWCERRPTAQVVAEMGTDGLRVWYAGSDGWDGAPLPESIQALLPAASNQAPATPSPSRPTPPVLSRPPCKYLLTQVTEEVCPSCQGFVRIKVMACQQHGLCTIAKPLAGKACCATCLDYSPASR